MCDLVAPIILSAYVKRKHHHSVLLHSTALGNYTRNNAWHANYSKQNNTGNSLTVLHTIIALKASRAELQNDKNYGNEE